jgi:hypothetical protein
MRRMTAGHLSKLDLGSYRSAQGRLQRFSPGSANGRNRRRAALKSANEIFPLLPHGGRSQGPLTGNRMSPSEAALA